MSDTRFLIRNQSLPNSQDYDFLRKAGTKHIENLAHKLWTEYNPSDPGITLLEAFCYAITDLGYRTNYELPDLLTKSVMGVPIPPKYFHQAREILTNNPVTFDDLRKMIIDIEGVRNAWVEKHKSIKYCLNTDIPALIDCPEIVEGEEWPENILTCDPLNGLYDVFVEFEEFVSDLKLGLPNKDLYKGKYEDPECGEMRLQVDRDILLKQLYVYAECPGEVVIRLLDAEGNELENTGPVFVDKENVKFPIELNWLLVPNNDPDLNFYILDAKGSTVDLYMNISGIDEECPMDIEGLIHILPGDRKEPTFLNYYFFYDLCIDFPEPGSTTYEKLITVGLPHEDLYEAKLMAPEGKAIVFDVEQKLTLIAVTVFGDKKGKVEIILSNAAGTELCRVPIQIKVVGMPTRVKLDAELHACQNYRIHAESEDGVELTMNTNVDFPYIEPRVILLLGGESDNQLSQNYYFFYNWEILYDKRVGEDIPQFPFTKSLVRSQIRDLLLSYRNLCEDLIEINDLLPEDIGVCADVELATGTDVEETLAQIHYVLEEYVKPAIRFYTLEEMLDKGKTTDMIFEGPKLQHGFIDDDEFVKTNRKKDLRASDIIQLIMDIPGVLAVKNLSLLSYIDEILCKQDKWLLCPDADPCRITNYSPARSNFIFYINGLPTYADKAQTALILQAKEAHDLKLKHKEHEDNLPIPVGEDMEVDDYFPLQNDLPLNYLVGQYRVPKSETELRKAQARQLKAYLLFFEQLLANYLAQLNQINELFSWEVADSAQPIRTYFTQLLHEHEIADLPELYIDYANLQQDLDEIIESPDEAHERKLRFLEHLIARFGETFTDYSLLMYQLFGKSNDTSRRIIEDKQLFLQNYPAISAERGKAYDYRYPENPENISGLQQRVYAQLGIRNSTRRMLAAHNVQILQNEDGAWYFIVFDEDGETWFTSIACPSRAAVSAMLDFILRISCEEEHFSYKTEHCDGEWQLIFTCDGEEDRLLGVIADEAAGDALMDYLQQYAVSEGFHVIEHILLRKRQAGDSFLPVFYPEDCDCPSVKDPYSFHASIILPGWSKRFRNRNFRKYVEDLIRLEAPAHVYLRICWIGHEDMRAFEECLEKWECELACLSPELNGAMALKHGESAIPKESVNTVYQNALNELIDKLYQLEQIYPPSVLHNCDNASATPSFLLGQSNLGTYG